ncbi:T9SS type A sorting domain-containing protein [candidate division KSB1 bacterium]|nr:T9SS type A sorting domain-containing protein [candidate division KSB1 bacterium]
MIKLFARAKNALFLTGLLVCFYTATANGQNIVFTNTRIDVDSVASWATSVTFGADSVVIGQNGSLQIETKSVAFTGPFMILSGGQLQIRTHNSQLTKSADTLSFSNNLVQTDLILYNNNASGPALEWKILDHFPKWIKISDGSEIVALGDSSLVTVSIDTLFIPKAGYYKDLLRIRSNLGEDSVAVHMMYSKKFAKIESPFKIGYGDKSTDYRLISVPGLLDDTSLKALLEDDLGEYDDKKWRVFGTDGQKNDTEYPLVSNLKRGDAVWILVKDSDKKVDVDNITISGDTLYDVSMDNQGWNLVGNPFNEVLSLNQNTVEMIGTNGTHFLTNEELWEYENGGWSLTGTMRPWRGYAVAAETIGDVLRFRPYNTNTAKAAQKPEWRIQIIATTEQAQDSANFAGIFKDARIENDPYDRFEPPAIGDYISVNFPHHDWPTYLKKYSAEYQSTEQDGWVWEIGIETNTAQKATLAFAGFETVPAEYRITLLDPSSQLRYDLRSMPSQTIATFGKGRTKRFKLLVGTDDYIAGTIGDDEALPETFMLHQNYPNPFNPVTTIRFDLPEERAVSLKIIDMLGREVANLIENTIFSAGRHSYIWDARNAIGERVSSGVYFYVLRAGDFRMHKKMVLLQ